MSDLNDEMKATADYAVKSAKNRYSLNLDYSEESITALDGILEKMYWGFSSRIDDRGRDGLIYNTAIIWGSYLGEYMRLKWGGSWKLKGTQQLIVIKNKEFSPISFVYQKITGHFNYKLEDYLFETNQAIGPAQSAPKQEQYIQNYSEALEKKISREQDKKTILTKRNLIYAAGIGGFLIVISICIIVLVNLLKGGLPAFGVIEPGTVTPTYTPMEIAAVIATDTPMITPSPTVTPLPTYTSEPTLTPSPSPSPSFTPFLTDTAIPTVTPSETPTPFIPTYTRTPTRTPTVRQSRPTKTFTSAPTNTATPIPPPTNTQPPPPTILSCSVNPTGVTAGEDHLLTFTVQFSAPGYGINGMNFSPQPIPPGAQGCTDNNNDGNSTATCQGHSGLLTYPQTVNVTISTPLGNCPVVSYHSTSP